MYTTHDRRNRHASRTGKMRASPREPRRAEALKKDDLARATLRSPLTIDSPLTIRRLGRPFGVWGVVFAPSASSADAARAGAQRHKVLHVLILLAASVRVLFFYVAAVAWDMGRGELSPTEPVWRMAFFVCDELPTLLFFTVRHRRAARAPCPHHRHPPRASPAGVARRCATHYLRAAPRRSGRRASCG